MKRLYGKRLSYHKLLGLIIDKDLSFEAHTDELCKKLSKRLGLLRHISQSKTQPPMVGGMVQNSTNQNHY